MSNPQKIDDQIWSERIKQQNRYYKQWEQLFRCDILEEYYEGRQWKSQRELQYNPYVINKIYETIQIKIAEFIPTFPIYNISPKPSEDDDLQAAAKSSMLKEDLTNTIVQDPATNFAEEAEQAYKDSFFRFGILEVGYDADWIDNPNAPKPLLESNVKSDTPFRKKPRIIDQPDKLPRNERVYIKHIPAKSFRIGGNDHKYLNRCGWCGYYEYVNKDDLLSLKIMNRDKIATAKATNGEEPDLESKSHSSTDKIIYNSLKIWKIWDLRARTRYVIVDTPCVTVFQRRFDRLPLFDLRPDRRLITNGFYPIPPAYHWLSPQDELNEIREMLRTHRRRFVRKFQYITGGVDEEEIEKFETGPDGALIRVNRENGILPIENADLGQSITEINSLSSDDLDKISGEAEPSRGISDRGTATEAKIVQLQGSVRQNKERDRVVKWLQGVGREIISIVKEEFTGKTLVRLNTTRQENFLGSVNQTQHQYRRVDPSELSDSFEFDINVDLTSLSSTAQQAEKQKMLEFLSTLTQFPMVAFSPYLIREIAVRVGYRNEKAIAEFQQMALLMELGRMQQLKAQANPPQQPNPGPAGQQIVANQTPPNAAEIQNQLTNQLGVTQ